MTCRWLIECLVAGHPSGQMLHVFDDDTLAWGADPRRALRFKSRADAERFGRQRVRGAFVARAYTPARLASPVRPRR